MLKIAQPDHTLEVVSFAIKQSILPQLLDQLHYLDHYAEPTEKYSTDLKRCLLVKDFAPYSFQFVMQRMVKPTGSPELSVHLVWMSMTEE